MRPPIAVLAAGIALLAASPGAAVAQQEPAAPQIPTAPEAPGASQVSRKAPGLVSARTFDAPQPGFAVAVVPYDDSALNLTLKGDFEKALAEQWRARSVNEAEAAFLLLFETEVVPANLAPPPATLGSAKADENSAEVNVNIWSSTQDSVLGGRQEGGKAGSNVFHLNALLRDRKSGEVVWQGDAYYVLSEPEPEHVARALVGPLVAKIGQSVAREPLQID